jgi:hypothetical protein
MDMTTNHLLQIVPSRDLLVSDGDMFQPLTTALNVSSLKGMLDYAPLDIYSFSTDLDKVLALENAEFKVAWIFANMGSNMFEVRAMHLNVRRATLKERLCLCPAVDHHPIYERIPHI